MSTILSSLPELPPLVPAGTKMNGKPIRIPPRVNLGSLTVNNLGTVKKLHNCLFPVAYSERFYQDSLNLDLSPEEFNKLVFYQDLAVGVLVARIEPLASEAPTDIDQAISNPSTETNDQNQAGYKLYIMTLGVLAPYRNQGLASKLVHNLLAAASQTLVQPAPDVESAPAPAPVAAANSAAAAAGPPPLSKKALKKAAQKGKAPLPPPVPAAAAKAEEPVLDSAEVEKERKKKERAEQDAKRSRRRIEHISLHVQVGNDDGRKFWEKFGFTVKETVPDYYRKIEPRDAWLLERPVLPPPRSTSS